VIVVVVVVGGDEEDVDVDVDVEKLVLGGGVYSGQSVLVGLHCVIVTVAVIYMVLVVVSAAAARAPAARTINDEACILSVVVAVWIPNRRRFVCFPTFPGPQV